jgi:peptide-methionine (R)-S-oxide reductase
MTDDQHDTDASAQQLPTDDAGWRARLDEDRYMVLRQGSTERPGSGALLHEHGDGSFHCAGCGALLFHSNAKFESGSGWPSFFEAADRDHVRLVADHSHGMTRTEVRCARCDGHLGHLFDDGPRPTGQRYCMNSLALEFEPTAD